MQKLTLYIPPSLCYINLTLVTKIQNNLKARLSKAEAIHRAVDSTINEGILYDILSRERNEVEMNILTEFDDEDFAKVMHDDGYDDGYTAGEADGFEKGVEKGIERKMAMGSRP